LIRIDRAAISTGGLAFPKIGEAVIIPCVRIARSGLAGGPWTNELTHCTVTRIEYV